MTFIESKVELLQKPQRHARNDGRDVGTFGDTPNRVPLRVQKNYFYFFNFRLDLEPDLLCAIELWSMNVVNCHHSDDQT